MTGLSFDDPAACRRLLVLLIFVALCVRVVYNIGWVGIDDVPVSDAADYHEIAVGLLKTGTIDHLGSPPLFPAMLAGVYGLFGVHPFVGRLFLCLADALTCGVIYLIGREAFGVRVGLLAAGAATVYGMLFRWTGYLLTETAFTLLLCLFIYLSQKTLHTLRWRYGLAAGLCLGLATLARPTR
ncbi:MAG: glycosyltransferase family 39 protein [candidate division Zixibacteria bacterium]|nr:glycosyltransferase family 39 protein [candidate division Zixibacteria bacterium]